MGSGTSITRVRNPNVTGHLQADDVAQLLEKPRKSSGGWVARCPVHDDRLPSLSIHDGKKGTILHCHASCRIADICAALGIKVAQLFPDYNPNGGGSSSIDLMLRELVKKSRADSYVPSTLGAVMGMAFTGEDDDWFRAYEFNSELMDLEFEEAYKMWGIVAETAVREYLRSWWDTLDPKTRDWFDIREKAMKKLASTYRERQRYANGY
jgi:hypothetical protein